MRILFLTRHYLFQNNGGSNASKGFLWSLANIAHDITLIYPEKVGYISNDFIPPNVKAIPVYDHRTVIRKGLDMYRGRVHRFHDFIKSHLSTSDYDIIIIDHSFTSIGVMRYIKKTGAKIITIHHNVEADYLKDNEPNWLYRIPYDYFVRKGEKKALELSDINLTLTNDDAEKFKSWYPNRDINVHTIGICDYKPLQKTRFETTSFNNIFVISGSLCFQQSVVPIIDFINRYLPIMKEVCPGCKLIITGRNPNKQLSSACRMQSNIELVPNPDDIDSIIRRASIYICPIFAGSGIKLRVMDGLKRGMPILCHEVSVSGYEKIFEAGYMFTYQDNKSFKDSLSAIINTNINSNDVYAKYLECFSLTSGIERLLAIFEDSELL